MFWMLRRLTSLFYFLKRLAKMLIYHPIILATLILLTIFLTRSPAA